ncbi:pyruvate dehydrogenase [Neisseria dentiae]|uniref:Pyruvate dehydrogenase complex repressor n=1 Tax=Neisseria dentiae TaxID=194197 RepID=A0A1X3D1S9_9NEIS|nr:FadR/GntR family transcriptional regulator [Neisseria dentiae]OSI13848.1 pyruvate dehydrogenase [Neisseria dentiae]QMT45408.1 FadR family transcriptional regulator [Neisseria dentiae]STZ51187.1 GntR family transcriptional regulator [Neisseria dentiae]
MPNKTAAGIKPPAIGMQIASVLEERILQNVYPIGCKLPPERRLAEEFGVSRQSLRAALHILATRGLLHARQGDGHYVSGNVEETFHYGWEDLIDAHEGMESEVLDFRRGIEGMLAALAAQRRTEADLARMENWLAKLREAYSQNNLDQQSAADVAFHQAVAEAAHNILFTRLSDGLLRLLTGQTKRNLGNMFGVPDVYAQLMAQHEAIFNAIAQQDAAAAAQAAYRHLDYVQNCLIRQREQQSREAVSNALAASDKLKPGFK